MHKFTKTALLYYAKPHYYLQYGRQLFSTTVSLNATVNVEKKETEVVKKKFTN